MRTRWRRTPPTWPCEDGHLSTPAAGRPDDPVDLRLLALPEGASVETVVPLGPIELRLGGMDYRIAGAERALLTLSRQPSGLLMGLRVGGDLSGPCWRCLEDAAVRIDIDATEFSAAEEGEGEPDPELVSVYLEDERVDVALWARDAFAEAVPPTILCRPDCAGLCPLCGADLNRAACGCAEPAGDARWEALRQAAERLGIDPGGDDPPRAGTGGEGAPD